MAGVIARKRRRSRKKRVQASSTARGYDHKHQQVRERWKPVVDGGHGYCHATVCLKATRWIPPGTPWHLGHTPDRTAWTGPEHAACNCSEGAKRGNASRSTTARVKQSRIW